jgi:hypothetical protein
MSITLINPSGYPSAQDNLWSIAYSNNSGQVDFKYVFDVFVDGVQLVRTKVFPEPSNGRGYFDAMPVVSNEITYGWFTPKFNDGTIDLPLLKASDTINEKIYQIRVGEDYSGTTFLNLASGNVTAYNYSAPLFKRRQINIGQKFNNWLTNRPLTIKAKLTDKILIPAFGNVINDLRVVSYNESNAVIKNWGYGYPDILKYNQWDIGAKVLNNISQALFSYQGIPSNTKYYTVKFTNSSTIETSLIRVDIDCNPNYTPINLYFINAYGMFDTARFNLASRLTMDVERKTFEQRNYTFNNSSVDYYDANNVYNESKINYGSKTNHSYKLTMDFPSDAEYVWLAELIVSPQIYAEIDGNYYPVSIKANNYEYSTYTNNRLRALEIDIELNQTRYNFKR